MNDLRRLYAAFVDADEAQLERIMGDRFPRKMIDAWQRVADAAQGRWKPSKTRERPKIEWVEPKVEAADVFCGQCDRLVKAAEALVCGSKFCKAKG